MAHLAPEGAAAYALAIVRPADPLHPWQTIRRDSHEAFMQTLGM